MNADQARGLLAETFTVFPPRSLTAAVRELEQLRHRTIRVVLSDPGDLVLPTALWAVLGLTIDLVWVDATLTPSHQLVALCHELGHMICGHAPTAFTEPSGAVDGIDRGVIARLAGGGAADQPTAALGRCGMLEPDVDPAGRRREQEAETVGRLLADPFLHAHQHALDRLLTGR